MAKGKFNASSGNALTVEATQNASAALITSDAANAMEVDSNSDVMTISVTNLGFGAGIATGCNSGPGVSASSHEGLGLVAVSDEAQAVSAYSPVETAVEATSDIGAAVVASSGGGTALIASSEDSHALVAHSSFQDSVVGYGNQYGSAAVFSNIKEQRMAGGQGQIAYFQAAEFFGNVAITGSFTVSGAKGFRIDHPLEPKRQWLHHAAVESDAMKNMYDGTISLNSLGKAVIRLPKWFEALNKDFRYLLTAIGAPAPNLHVSHEIRNGQFGIAGGNPRMKVSWQVTGTRKDAWASTHPFASEEMKSKKERGYSICPTSRGGRGGLKTVLSPSIYEKVVSLDELEKNASARKQRIKTLMKQERKRRPKS